MFKCAGCGREIPVLNARHFGPLGLQKCQACGPFTPDELMQVKRHITASNGFVHVSAARNNQLGGCNCLGRR